MPGTRPEPPFTHGTAPRIGIVLVNLGTPDAPTPRALRKYLKQFLSDPRVVEVPRLIWWPILNGFILNTRPRQSAEKYATVWSDEGSPLRAHTERQAKLLADHLHNAAGLPDMQVASAMRYGEPSIPNTLHALKSQGCTRILVLPLYPQYSGSTTASVVDEVSRYMMSLRNQPEIRTLRGFCDDPGYVRALARNVREHWKAHGQGEKLLMSFHGIPRRSLDLGDPYHCECHKTARLVAEELELPRDKWMVTFQSRFGKAEWLQPYTEPTLQKLAGEGLKRADVICPGFVSDCLETLEEIAMECKEAFLEAGGETFHYIPCLNEEHEWIEALSDLAQTSIGDWLQKASPTAETLQLQSRLARELGAER